MNKRLLKIAKGLNEAGLNVIDNFENKGIICCGFYIYDVSHHFRIFKNSNFFDLDKASSVIDFIVNNTCSMVVTISE